MRLAPACLLACLLLSTASIRAARAGDGGDTGGTGGTGGEIAEPDGGITIPESMTPDNFGCTAAPAPPPLSGGALALLGTAALCSARLRRRR